LIEQESGVRSQESGVRSQESGVRSQINLYQIIMSKVTSIEKARSAKLKKTAIAPNADGFTPCSPDMTICGDCIDNRTRKKCPRLKEWLAKQER
jgi:hypothetical protein